MRRRIVSLYLILAVIVSSIVGFVTFRYSSQTYINEVENALKHEVVLMTRIVQEENSKGPNRITDEFLRGLTKLLEDRDAGSKSPAKSRRITIIDETGKVIADSVAHSSTMENHLQRPEVRAALQGKIGMDIRKSATTGTSFLYLACYSPETKDIIRVAASVEYIDEIRDTILFYTIVAIFVGLVISSLIAIALSGYVTRPIARLVKKYGALGGAEDVKG
ncbi:MAG: hypothetical protein N2376_02535, partial [Clostridia bacterium]|nr:hypothetical protein [Clostridia bacterium]